MSAKATFDIFLVVTAFGGIANVFFLHYSVERLFKYMKVHQMAIYSSIGRPEMMGFALYSPHAGIRDFLSRREYLKYDDPVLIRMCSWVRASIVLLLLTLALLLLFLVWIWFK